MIRWLPEDTRAVPSALSAMDYPPWFMQLLLARGLDSPQAIEGFLAPSLGDLHDPLALSDMEAAVGVIQQAIARGESMVVYGDYDVDGICATSILLTYLKKQGAAVGHVIPSRHKEGYGLNLGAVERLAKQYKLMITVDCGITSVEEVARARELGMKVIVTDHHQLGPQLPRCEAVINPLLAGYPFSKLCGAGVAWKLVCALGGLEAALPLVDLAALATVADLVPMLGENRIIVKAGLEAIQTARRPGLRALIEVAGLAGKTLSAGHLGFQLAPRLNAAGRLQDAARGVQLMTTRDPGEAEAIARELDDLNRERQQLEQDMLAQALAMVPREVVFQADRAILLAGGEWNPGVIGLVASKLVERYRWPVILFAREGGMLTGSARSIPGIDIHLALSQCKDLFVRFGGHAQAAGLTMAADNLPALRERLNQAIAAQAGPDTFLPTQRYDVEVPLGEVDIDLVARVELLAPNGIGNPAPVFCVRGVQALDARAIGREGAHLKCRLAQEGSVVEAIAFGLGEQLGALPERLDVLFSPGINRWQDREMVQCEVRSVQPSAPARAFLASCSGQEEGFLRAIYHQIRYNRDNLGHDERVDCQWLSTAALEARLSQALRRGPQGVLMVCQTLPAVRKWIVRLGVMGVSLDYAFQRQPDPRLFHTLLAAPQGELTHPAAMPSTVALLDGALCQGMLANLRAAYPKAEILLCADAQAQRADALNKLIPSDEALRGAYRVVKAGPEPSLEALALKMGLTAPAAQAALDILAELRLLAWGSAPWFVELLPPRKCSLTDSALLTQLRAAADFGPQEPVQTVPKGRVMPVSVGL